MWGVGCRVKGVECRVAEWTGSALEVASGLAEGLGGVRLAEPHRHQHHDLSRARI